MHELLFGPGPVLWVQRLLGESALPAMELIDYPATTWGVLAALALWLRGRAGALAVLAIVATEALANLALNQVFSTARPSPAEVRARTSAAFPAATSSPPP